MALLSTANLFVSASHGIIYLMVSTTESFSAEKNYNIMMLSQNLSGRGALTYNSDGVCLLMHQIKGVSVTIFLRKWESLGDRSEKGNHWVWNCTKSEQLFFFFQILAAICKFFQKLMILPENFDQKSKNRRSLGVKLWKSGHSGTNRCRKGGLLTGAWRIPANWSAPLAMELSQETTLC